MNGNVSPADIAAVMGNRDRDDGFFGDGIWGIIMLLIVAGLFTGNGFGWGGNRGNAFETDIDTRFLERDIFSTNQNVSNTACQTQRDVLESRYTTQLGLSQLGANIQNCCCNTQKEILQNRYDNALQTNTLQAQASTNALQAQMQLADCCCDLKNAIHAEGEATRNQMQQDKIDQLREQVNTTNLALNNANLANQIITSLRPTPIPAYITCSPYSSAYYGNGYGYGCGCGNSSVL
nr:MAG TPA: Protein of unknown function (DUF4087) [Caudoviricetes sp.]